MKLLLFLLSLGVALLGLSNAYLYDQYRSCAEISVELSDSLFAKNDQLGSALREAAFYKSKLDEIDDRIASLKSRGYRPDPLLIRYTQRMSERYGIPISFVDSVLKKESSFWSDTRGLAGEFGGFQIMPSTMKYYLNLFGADTTRFKASDYSDIITGTEWAYVMFFHMKLKDQLNWNNHNNGKYLK